MINLTVRQFLDLYKTFPHQTRFVFKEFRNLNNKRTVYDHNNMNEEILCRKVMDFAVIANQGCVTTSAGWQTPETTTYIVVDHLPNIIKKNIYVPSKDEIPEPWRAEWDSDYEDTGTHTDTHVDDTASPSVPVITCMV